MRIGSSLRGSAKQSPTYLLKIASSPRKAEIPRNDNSRLRFISNDACDSIELVTRAGRFYIKRDHLAQIGRDD